MRGETVQVFDELIEGSSSTWYTSSRFNNVLQSGDCFAIQAVTTRVDGFLPTLTVHLEESEDTERWVRDATPLFNGQGIAEEGSYGSFRLGVDPVLSSFARFAIALGGSSPKCRLKLYVTVRAYEPVRQAPDAGEPQP